MTPSPTRRPRAAAIAGLESRMIEFGIGFVVANATLTVALLELL